MIYKRYKIKKLIDAINYLLARNGGSLNYTKLIKLLYLADRKALTDWAFTITGDRYYALKNGPVLSQTFDLIKGKAETDIQSLWDEFFYTDGYDLIGENVDRPQNSLSPIEEEILEQIDNQYKSLSYQKMIDIVHTTDVCPEWNDPSQGSSPITLEDILKTTGKTEAEIKAILDEYYSNEEDEQFFLENCG